MMRIALLTLLLAGCGQKGPLYFAEPEDVASATQVPATTESVTRDGEQNDNDKGAAAP